MEHTPFWWSAAGEPAPLNDERPLPTHADVVVVGAGLTGLSAARTLARAGQHVVVIERGPPGIGASSRNGGQVGGGHRLPAAVLDAQYGAETATRLLREAHIDSVNFFHDLLDTESIECDWQAVGRFRGNWTQREYDAAARDTERLNQRIGLAAHTVPRTEQQAEIATDLYCGGTVFPTHGAINPAKFTRGLARAARAAGADIHSFTELQAIRREGRQQRVETSRGAILAGNVLAATNGYSGPALPTLQRRIVPVPSFIVATEPLGENRVRDLMPARRVYVESRVRHCYFRPSPDGERLIFGGRAALFPVSEGVAVSQLRKPTGCTLPWVTQATATPWHPTWATRRPCAFSVIQRARPRLRTPGSKAVSGTADVPGSCLRRISNSACKISGIRCVTRAKGSLPRAAGTSDHITAERLGGR